MGQLLRASLEQLKLEILIKGSLLSSSYAQYGILATPCWLTFQFDARAIRYLFLFLLTMAFGAPSTASEFVSPFSSGRFRGGHGYRVWTSPDQGSLAGAP
jgi:hypothetical protein